MNLVKVHNVQVNVLRINLKIMLHIYEIRRSINAAVFWHKDKEFLLLEISRTRDSVFSLSVNTTDKIFHLHDWYYSDKPVTLLQWLEELGDRDMATTRVSEYLARGVLLV